MSITKEFNGGVQFDLLFLDDSIVVHVVCLCIKWAQAVFVEDRELETILPALVQMWFRVYGPPQYIVSDQEGT
eukprot:3843725-Prorocentrum_lima.AAC.1